MHKGVRERGAGGPLVLGTPLAPPMQSSLLLYSTAAMKARQSKLPPGNWPGLTSLSVPAGQRPILVKGGQPLGPTIHR